MISYTNFDGSNIRLIALHAVAATTLSVLNPAELGLHMLLFRYMYLFLPWSELAHSC